MSQNAGHTMLAPRTCVVAISVMQVPKCRPHHGRTMCMRSGRSRHACDKTQATPCPTPRACVQAIPSCATAQLRPICRCALRLTADSSSGTPQAWLLCGFVVVWKGRPALHI
eukprot:363936-Chlamydomonas_euryale.AAC.4